MSDYIKCPICEVGYFKGKHTKEECKKHAKTKEMRKVAGNMAIKKINKLL